MTSSKITQRKVSGRSFLCYHNVNNTVLALFLCFIHGSLCYASMVSNTRWRARAESINAVWISYEEVKKSLETITESENLDRKTKLSATSLDNKMESADFIAIMFMENIITKTKQVTEALQAPDFNTVDALTIVGSTIQSLKYVQ